MVLRAVAALVGLGLLAVGVWFLADPETALATSAHGAERLPAVMGGRYALFGGLLLAALWRDDRAGLVILLAGLGALGLLDAWLYRGDGPIPHMLAGLAALGGAALFARRDG